MNDLCTYEWEHPWRSQSYRFFPSPSVPRPDNLENGRILTDVGDATRNVYLLSFVMGAYMQPILNKIHFLNILNLLYLVKPTISDLIQLQLYATGFYLFISFGPVW